MEIRVDMSGRRLSSEVVRMEYTRWARMARKWFGSIRYLPAPFWCPSELNIISIRDRPFRLSLCVPLEFLAGGECRAGPDGNVSA